MAKRYNNKPLRSSTPFKGEDGKWYNDPKEYVQNNLISYDAGGKLPNLPALNMNEILNDGVGAGSPGGSGVPSSKLPSQLSINDLLSILNGQNGSSLGSESKDSTYFDMLRNLGGGDQFTKWIEQLGYNGGKSLSNDQIADYNKQLLDLYLNYVSELEKRNYNEGIRDEQRLYDSPTNQLARLMGSGISRDMAIQLLGSGSSSGVSGAFTDGMGLSSTLAPSESRNNQIESATAIANTVFGGLSALGGLVGLGFSIPQAVQQTKLLANQSYMSDQQRTAYDAASSAYTIITNAGVKNASEVFGSVQTTASTIESLAKSGNQAALEFVNSGGVANLLKTSPVSSPLLAQMYKNERDAGDYAKMTDAAINQARLNQAYTSAMTSKVGAESSLIGTQEDLVSQNIIESCHRVAQIDADIYVKNEQGNFTKIQSENYKRLIDSQIHLNNANADLLDQQFELNAAGFPMLKESRILQLQDELAHLKLINEPAFREQRLSTWAQQENNARSLAYLESLFNNAVGDFAENHAALWNLACAFHYCGADKVVKTGAKAAELAAFKF